MGGGTVISSVLMFVLAIHFGKAFYFPDVAQFELSEVLNKHCGCTKYNDRERPPEARLQESPWLALLYYPDEPDHFCHGTLITKRHILTTAVCGINVDENDTLIVLGEYDLHVVDQDCEGNKCSDPVQRRRAHKVIVHEEFDGESFQNDLAIVVLDWDVLLTDFVKPICLPVIKFEIGTINQPNVYNTLWTSKPRPQQYWMRYVDLDSCRKLVQYRIMINEGQICARSHNNRTIEMMGGAGSALEVEYHNRIYQVAMLSIGVLDSDSETPFIYVDIPKYIQWIHDSVKENQ